MTGQLFEPVNDDHAIERVAFTVGFVRPFQAEEISNIRRQHVRWANELPAIREPQGFSVVIDDGHNVRMAPITGLEFAFVRPDGSAVWSLRLVGQELIVECSRYTRWDRVWATAKSFLTEALGVLLVEGDEGNSIQSLSLIVQDAFRAEEESYDLHYLLQASDLVPLSVFKRGSDWHSHTGWFETVAEQRVLHNLNVDGVGASSVIPKGSAGAQVRVLHVMNVFPQRSAELNAESSRTQWLSTTMEALHQANKTTIGSILAASISERIGLGQW